MSGDVISVPAFAVAISFAGVITVTLWLPGSSSIYAAPSSLLSCAVLVLIPDIFFACDCGPMMAKASDKLCWRSSAGSCTPPDCYQKSIQRSANTTRHSSPAFTGKVNVTPPPLGNITGTSTSRGKDTEVVFPS